MQNRCAMQENAKIGAHLNLREERGTWRRGLALSRELLDVIPQRATPFAVGAAANFRQIPERVPNRSEWRARPLRRAQDPVIMSLIELLL